MYRNIQTGPAREIAKKLAGIIQSRKENYSGAVFKIVLVKHDSSFYPYWAKIELIHLGEGKDAGTKLDYSEVFLMSYSLSVGEVQSLLIDISERNAFETPDKLEIPLEERNGELIMLGTQLNYGHASHPWPCYFGEFVFPTFNFNLSRSPLVKRSLPTYPDIQTASRDFLGLAAKPDEYTSDHRLIIALPDFRARITGVTISNRKVSLGIDRKIVNPGDVAAKIYMSDGKSSFQSSVLIFDESKSVTCEASFEPEIIHAYIVDNQNEIIDWRDINLKHSYYTSDTRIETPSLQIIEMAKRGERDDVEFKEKVGDEFLETFVSFANTDGGIILLGVNDHCKIIGIDENVEKLREKLAARIARNVEPPSIKFDLEKVGVDDEKEIILIRVREGERKPYSLHDKGILVRRGSSDRWISPSELDDIYSKRNGLQRDRQTVWY